MPSKADKYLSKLLVNSPDVRNKYDIMQMQEEGFPNKWKKKRIYKSAISLLKTLPSEFTPAAKRRILMQAHNLALSSAEYYSQSKIIEEGEQNAVLYYLFFVALPDIYRSDADFE